MNGRYGWVMVAAGALMGCVAVGALMSLAVFLAPITESTGWSRTGVSSAMTVSFLVMGAAGFAWGALSDRYGTRPVVLAGAVLLGLGLVAASRATSPLEFVLAYGVLVGAASGSFFVPMMAAVAAWIPQRTSLAVSLVSMGVGVAPMTISPFAAWLISSTDWRTAQLVIALLVWATLIPAAFFVRPPPAVPAGAAPATPSGQQGDLGKALRSPQFIVLALTFFACCATHSGPIFHTVSYAIACGLPVTTAVTIYSMEGLAGLGGRVALGYFADKVGVKRVIVGGLLVQAFAAGAFIYARRLEEFYAVAIVFGFAYGGVMPLYASLAREYFSQRIMGAILGAAMMISSLGMALGPAVGGWIFDTYGEYAWLYIGSFLIGLGAAAIALAFPKPGAPPKASGGLRARTADSPREIAPRGSVPLAE